MKFLLSFLLIALLIAPSSALANVKAGWEWHQVDNNNKRTLHVCFHRNMSDQWKEWGRAAMKLWNDVKEDTGWDFEEVPFNRAQCQIFIVMSDIDESNTGGAEINALDTLEGQDEQPDGRVNGAIINIDSNLEDSLEWIGEDEDTSDGSHDGWSTDVDEGTRDPIDVLAHELSHALRLDHHDDYTNRNPDSDISDPKQNGEHYHALSPADIRQATASNTAAWVRNTKSVGANGGKNLSIGNLFLDIPEYTFGMNYRNHNVSVLDMSDLIFTPFNVPEGHSRVFDSVGIFTDVPIQKPIQVTMPYDESGLLPRGMSMNNSERLFTPGLLENTITVVRFEKRAWDLTPEEIGPNPSSWEMIESGTIETELVYLDLENNQVTFQMNQTGYFGLIAAEDPKQPSNDPGFTIVRDGEVVEVEVGSKDSRRAAFTAGENAAKLISSKSLVVGFGIGALLAGIFIVLWRKKKKKRN